MSQSKHDSTPVYQQIANILRARIMDLDSESSKILPKERELAVVHGVARGTIRRALDILASEGLIRRTRRQGTVTLPEGIRAWRQTRQRLPIVVVTSFQSPFDSPMGFYGQVFQGVLTSAEEAGYNISIKQMRGSFPDVDAAYQPEDASEVLGVLTINIFDDQVVTMHTQAGYPVVCLDHWTAETRADAVVFDCFTEGQVAVEYLLLQGHRDLFFLGNIYGPKSRSGRERDAELLLTGCRYALRAAGLELPDDKVAYCRPPVSSQQPSDDVTRAATWYASLCPRPTAGVIFGSGTMAQFCEELKQVGLSCPADVSLICKAHEGDPITATTLRGQAYQLGETGVEVLLDRASGRQPLVRRVVLPTRLERGPTVRQLR